MQGTSQITEAIRSIIQHIECIPYRWPEGDDMPAACKLFQWVAVWNNQLQQWKAGKGFPVQRPCCFVELNLGPAAAMGRGVTLYRDVKIMLHIVDWQVDAGDGTLDQNLQVITWRDLLKTNMERFFPQHCGAMTTLSEEQDYAHTGVYHYIITFRTSLSDLQGSWMNPGQNTVILTSPPGGTGTLWGFEPTINLDDESDWPPPPPSPPPHGGGGFSGGGHSGGGEAPGTGGGGSITGGGHSGGGEAPGTDGGGSVTGGGGIAHNPSVDLK